MVCTDTVYLVSILLMYHGVYEYFTHSEHLMKVPWVYECCLHSERLMDNVQIVSILEIHAVYPK